MPSRSDDSSNRLKADTELANSLRQLSLNTGSAAASPASTRSPRGPTQSHPTLSPGAMANRPSPVRSSSRSSYVARDRTCTPTLLRKASANSLRSNAASATPTTPITATRPGSTTGTASRRASTQMTPSPLRRSSSSPERPLQTASSLASDYFAAELEEFHGEASIGQTETVVILNDACYGHRFSRPHTTARGLSLIVERPERIKAGVLGVAMAYVRLGERHADGKHAITSKLSPNSGSGMPFRIRKTSRILPLMSPAVTNVHGTKWMEELKLMCKTAESKLALGEGELKRPDMDRGPDSENPPELHSGDLYLCSESLEALEGSLGAVCEAVDIVFTTMSRRAFVAVRPPGHHCSASYPSGFCWVNNVHVGIMHASMHHSLTHAAIIDFDLHHGDGSQSITWAHNSKVLKLPRNAAAWRKTSIGYFSIHDINSYPCEYGDEDKVRNASLCIENAHGQNVWNVHLQSWRSEAEFWTLYETRYSAMLEKTRVYLRNQAQRLMAINQIPKAAIFLSAGFDASEWESSGMQRHKVNVPTEFYARITQDVIQIAAEEGLGVDGRVISVLEGGYSDRALTSGICSHLCGLVSSQNTPVLSPASGSGLAASANGLSVDMSQRLGRIPSNGPTPKDSALASIHAYDPSWWSSNELDKLDAPPAPPPPPRRATPPTYCSPTHSSTAKAVDPARLRRSLSGIGPHPNSPHGSRPGSSPTISWVIASRMLAKLLIPTDRAVDSCKPEELSAKATKARHDRQTDIMQAAGVPIPIEPAVAPPALPAPVPQPTRASTRERKTVKHFGFDRPVSRGRGKAASSITTEKAAARGIPEIGPQNMDARRLSTTSLATSVAPSVSLQAIVRPVSAASMRPDSSISVRSLSLDILPIKQTRNTVTRAPKGKKANPTVTVSTGADFRESTTSTASSNSNANSDLSSVTTAPEKDPVDALASDVKKIRITFITKAQREAREKEAREKAEREVQGGEVEKTAEREAAADDARILLVPEESTVSTEAPTKKFSDPPKRIPSIPNSSPMDVDADFFTPIAPSTAPLDIAFTMSEPASPSNLPKPNLSGLPLTSSSMGSDITGFSPAGRTRINSISSVASSATAPSWVPPTSRVPMSPIGSSSPSSPGRRSDIPIFTATSHIPFAPRRAGSGESSVRSSPGSSVGSGLVRAQAAKIAAMEAAATGQAAWGARPPGRSN